MYPCFLDVINIIMNGRDQNFRLLRVWWCHYEEKQIITNKKNRKYKGIQLVYEYKYMNIKYMNIIDEIYEHVKIMDII